MAGDNTVADANCCAFCDLVSISMKTLEIDSKKSESCGNRQ